MHQTRLPDFIGIGPGRTGTSWLYEVFLEHPEICMAHGTKETSFFDINHEKGLRWYASFFKQCSPTMLAGEITTNYIYHELAAERIYQMVPDVKLISVLRNPFERLRSVFSYRKRSGEIAPDYTLEAAISVYPDLIEHNQYATLLHRYIKFFPREQLYIGFYDDLNTDPSQFIHDILSFLGVDTAFESQVVHQRVNVASENRSSVLGTISKLSSRFLRQTQLLALLDAAKRSQLVRRIMLKPTSFSSPEYQLSEVTYDKLVKLWSPELEDIAKLTGKDLTHWLAMPGSP